MRGGGASSGRIAYRAHMVPLRYVNVDAARARFGPLVDRLAPSLLRCDPLADEAVAALAGAGNTGRGALDRALAGETNDVPTAVTALVEAAASFPVWVDEARLDRAGQLLFRSGVPGGVALGAKSLLLGYTSPGGNKPLMLSGRLRSGVSRRLAETAKFVSAVAEKGGLRPGREGFAITLRVRLIHAQVRRLIWTTAEWSNEDWGAPINQHDMMATILLFANAWLDGIEALGIHVSEEEAEDYVHLWRVAGHIMGVEHDLLSATRAEGQRMTELIDMTQAPPDDDSRALVQAFFQHPLDAAPDAKTRKTVARRMQAYAGVTRRLLGDEMADQLGLPNDGWRYTGLAIREIVRRAERLRRRVPGGEQLALQAGQKHWKRVVELGLDGIPADFTLPSELFRRAA